MAKTEDLSTPKGVSAKLISSTLAGVMAVGMVPAIALADQVAEAPQGSAIELQAVGVNDVAMLFSQGVITEVTSATNESGTITKQTTGATVYTTEIVDGALTVNANVAAASTGSDDTAAAAPVYLLPTKVKPLKADGTALDEEKALATTGSTVAVSYKFYEEKADGSIDTTKEITPSATPAQNGKFASNYWVRTTVTSSDYENGSLDLHVIINKVDITDAVIVSDDDNAMDTTAKTSPFAYTASALAGLKFKLGDTYLDENYLNVAVWREGQSYDSLTKVVDPGTYNVSATPKATAHATSGIAGSQIYTGSISGTLVVEGTDLSKADIAFTTATTPNTVNVDNLGTNAVVDNVTVNGEDIHTLIKITPYKYTGAANVTVSNGAWSGLATMASDQGNYVGVYTYKVEPATDAIKNAGQVTGEGYVSYTVTDSASSTVVTLTSGNVRYNTGNATTPNVLIAGITGYNNGAFTVDESATASATVLNSFDLAKVSLNAAGAVNDTLKYTLAGSTATADVPFTVKAVNADTKAEVTLDSEDTVLAPGTWALTVTADPEGVTAGQATGSATYTVTVQKGDFSTSTITAKFDAGDGEGYKLICSSRRQEAKSGHSPAS